MPKLSKRLEEARDWAINNMFKTGYTVEEIGIIFTLTTGAVYNIIKQHKEREKKHARKSINQNSDL